MFVALVLLVWLTCGGKAALLVLLPLLGVQAVASLGGR
jgi:hypothetical protein